MINLRTFATTLVTLAALAATAGFAQTTGDSAPTATVTAVNTLSVTGGGTVSLSPSVGSPAADSSTTLAYETNDGSTYRVKVDADVAGWSFTPSVTGNLAGAYPVLTVNSVTADAGTAAAGSGTLIAADNAVTPFDVVTGITNAKGTATVTLGASVTQTVVAGSYSTTLTYTLTTP